MSYAEKISDEEKIYRDIEEKIACRGAAITGACLFYDMTPGGSHNMVELFNSFIELLLYCNAHKLYSIRDNALKKILDMNAE